MRARGRRNAAGFAAALVLAVAPGTGTVARAQRTVDLAACTSSEVDRALRLLRRSALDLLGRPPTYEEAQRVLTSPEPMEAAAAFVEEVFSLSRYEEELYRELRRWFALQIWNGLGNLGTVLPDRLRLARTRNGVYYLPSKRRDYRGEPLDTTCLDGEADEQRPDEYDAQGLPRFKSGNREGWVWVRPFWDPDNPIRVCAFDAQERERWTDDEGQEVLCASSNRHRGCGCGPNLRWCLPAENLSEATRRVRRALAEEPERIFEWVVREGRPYHEVFTTRTGFVTGASSYYFRHMSRTAFLYSNGDRVVNPQLGTLPDVPFDDDTWHRYERSEVHSGVLTTFAYLIRFASNRGRANHFYRAFRCEPFVPSGDGLRVSEEMPSPNLRERSGCASCHEKLEPLAAHWGRWRVGGLQFGYLGDRLVPDAVLSPEPSAYVYVADMAEPRCRCERARDENNPRRCARLCTTYYVTAVSVHADTFEQYGGQPLAAAYLHPDEVGALASGPRALLDEPEEQRAVGRCAVRRLAERLLGRPLQPGEEGWLGEQVAEFERDGYDYLHMFQRLLRDERYRREL